MAEKRHLDNAPIKEAIIDIKVSFENGIDMEALKSKLTEIENDYPDHEELEKRGLSIEETHEKVTHTTINEGLYSFKYYNDDRTHIAQFKKDGFTFSRIEPYTDWETFKKEAFRLWEIYSNVTSPKKINRVAVRYVNIMELDGDETNLEEYLEFIPATPFSNSKVEGYLNRNVIYNYPYDSNVILTNALELIAENKIRVILDIDAFKKKEFDIDSDLYMKQFEKLHDLKNEIFFKSITERTARLYE